MCALVLPTRLEELSFAPRPGHGTPAAVESRKFPARLLPSRKTWEVDCRPHGRIESVLFPGSTTPVKLVNREMAEEVRRAILRDIRRGVPEQIAVAPFLPRNWLLEASVERWMKHLEAQVEAGDRSPNYLRRLRDFTGPNGHFASLYGTSIFSIDYGVLEDLAHELQDQMSRTSVVHVMSSLRTCLRWVAKRSSGTYQAPEFPELRRNEYEPAILAPEEQNAVLEGIPASKRGAFLAMADLMIRPGEARGLNVEDYDPKRRELHIKHAMKGLTHAAPRGGTKSHDRRLLRVTARLESWIEQYVGAEQRLRAVGPLFANPDGRADDRRFSYYTLVDIWRQAASRAGVGPIGLYNGTKHSTATWLRGSGLHLDEIALALGHSAGGRGQGDVTERYARPPRLANETIVRLLDSRR